MLFFDAHYSQLAASLAKSPSSSLPTWTKTLVAIEAKVYPPAIAVGKFLCHLSLICIPNWGYQISPDLTPTVASSATAEYWVWRTWSCWSTKSKELAQLSVTTAKLTLCDSLPSIAVVGGQEKIHHAASNDTGNSVLSASVTVDSDFEVPSDDGKKKKAITSIGILIAALLLLLLVAGIMWSKGYIGGKIAADKGLKHVKV